MRGVKAATKMTRIAYAAIGPLYPLWKTLIPKYVTTTVQVGRAMIAVAQNGAPKRILETDDINAIQV